MPNVVASGAVNPLTGHDVGQKWKSIMININIVEPGSIIEFILEGESNVDEVLDIIRCHYCNIAKGVLWNFNIGSNSNLNARDMIRIAQMVKKCAIHKRTAYVGSVDVEFGLLRMYETYAAIESVPPVMKVFRDRTKAIEWINEID